MVSHINYFEFLGKKSTDFGIAITKSNTYISSERDVKFISVPSFNGDYFQDNQRRKNVTVKYTCAVIPIKDFNSREEQLSAISTWLNSKIDGYSKLYDSYNPEVYRQAVYHSKLEPEQSKADVYKLNVSFTCKPFKYEIEGDTPLIYTNSEGLNITLTNNKATDSYPMIALTPTTLARGEMNFKLNGVNWYVQANDTVIFDSEQGKVYNDNTFFLYHNGNADIFIPPTSMPALFNGDNTIQVDGPDISNIGKFTIIPRWCRI